MTLVPARLRGLMAGDGLRARALRGTLVTFLGFGSQQFLRLASNLVLTRLLFPEAFGLMALVNIVLMGVQLLSDIGFSTAIVQSKRGDDPTFLNTAWTLQLVRGVILGLIVAAISIPVARVYGEPQLAQLLPVAGLNAVILGTSSGKIWIANRHIVLGRMTMLELGSQSFGIAMMVGLAWLTGSVWSLLIGMLMASAMKSLLSHLLLPGPASRLTWEPTAVRELFHFGKFLFFSSMATFLVNNADRAILGKFISMAGLGIYNIGYFPASIPTLLTGQFGYRVLLPLYTKTPPGESAQNRAKIRRARVLLAAGLIGIGLFLGLIGEIFVELLYEDTYHLAGPIMVLLSLAFLPAPALNGYDMLLLARGNSRDYAIKLVLLALCQTGLLFFLVRDFGLIGAVVARPAAQLLLYPLTAFFAQRARGWDPLVDLALLAVILLGAAGVLWVNEDAVRAVLQAG